MSFKVLLGSGIVQDGANNFLKFAAGIGILVAGAGIGYHYAIYLPQVERNEILRAEKALKAQADIEREKIAKAEQARKAQEDLVNEQKLRAKVNYDLCVLEAYKNYELNWANNCGTHGTNTSEKDCRLPGYIAEPLAKRRDENESKCLEILKTEL